MNILAINLELSDDYEATRLINEGQLNIYHAFTLEGVTVLLATYKMDLAILGFRERTVDFNEIIRFLDKMYPELKLIITMWDKKGKAVSFIKQEDIPITLIDQVLPKIIAQENDYRTAGNAS